MDSNFLFMDETINSKLVFPLTSLTGMLIPMRKYESIRSGLYEIANEHIASESASILLILPELHYNKFLEKYSDDVKYAVLEAIVELVVSLEIKIYRVSYYSTPETKKFFVHDPDLLGLCWFGIVAVTSDARKNKMLIPVLDAGFNQSFQKIVDKFSMFGKNCDVLRHSIIKKSQTILYSEMIAEPMYADSKHSMLIQLVDCIAGLRRDLDTKNIIGFKDRSVYKERMATIAKKLDDNMCNEEIIEIKLN